MFSGPVRTRLFPVSPPGCGGPYPSTVPTPAPQQAFFWGWAKTSTDKPSHENTHPPQGRSQPPKMYKTIHTKAHLPATGTEPNYTLPEVHGRVHELTSTRTTENTTVPESQTHMSRSTAMNTRTGPVPSPRGQQGADISRHRVRGLSPHVRPGQVPSPRSSGGQGGAGRGSRGRRKRAGQARDGRGGSPCSGAALQPHIRSTQARALSHTETPPPPPAPSCCHLCPGHPHVPAGRKKPGEASHCHHKSQYKGKEKLNISAGMSGDTFPQGILGSRPHSAGHGQGGGIHLIGPMSAHAKDTDLRPAGMGRPPGEPPGPPLWPTHPLSHQHHSVAPWLWDRHLSPFVIWPRPRFFSLGLCQRCSSTKKAPAPTFWHSAHPSNQRHLPRDAAPVPAKKRVLTSLLE